MNRDHTELIESILLSKPYHMKCLKAVRDLNLPDWGIGAGFVRNAIWDHLHGFAENTPLNDVDVLYFDANDLSRTTEKTLEAQLRNVYPDIPWEVRNQARMHLAKGNPPYTSTHDALRYWLETPTCVAVRLGKTDTFEFLAPYGLDDLVNMHCRPTPAGDKNLNQFIERMRNKNWPKTWPRVTVKHLTD